MDLKRDQIEVAWLKTMSLKTYNGKLKTDKPQETSGEIQRTFGISTGRDYVYYDLMIMKRNGTMKFFYVLRGMEKNEIENQLNEHWDKSDTLGYRL